MFAGKSDELLRRIGRLKYSKMSFMLFKPQIDSRYSSDKVVTHKGQSVSAISVNDAHEIIDQWLVAKTDVVAIDEAQFFSPNDRINLVDAVKLLTGHGCRIIMSGLDLDARGNAFGLMPALMAIADEVVKLKACCSVCGADAPRTVSKAVQTSVIDVGGVEKYEARCLIHFSDTP
jgi:thymidine kinase